MAEIGALSDADVDEAVATWLIDDRPAKVGLRNKARRFGHTARVITGTELNHTDPSRTCITVTSTYYAQSSECTKR